MVYMHELEDDSEDAPPSEPPAAQSHYMYVQCHITTNMVYTDPTGKL
jgi:hypothetical protein